MLLRRCVSFISRYPTCRHTIVYLVGYVPCNFGAGTLLLTTFPMRTVSPLSAALGGVGRILQEDQKRNMSHAHYRALWARRIFTYMVVMQSTNTRSYNQAHTFDTERTRACMLHD